MSWYSQRTTGKVHRRRRKKKHDGSQALNRNCNGSINQKPKLDDSCLMAVSRQIEYIFSLVMFFSYRGVEETKCSSPAAPGFAHLVDRN